MLPSICLHSSGLGAGRGTHSSPGPEGTAEQVLAESEKTLTAARLCRCSVQAEGAVATSWVTRLLVFISENELSNNGRCMINRTVDVQPVEALLRMTVALSITESRTPSRNR